MPTPTHTAVQQRDAAERFATEHAREIAAEIIEWQGTSILRDGKLREMARLCEFAGHDALKVAEHIATSIVLRLFASLPAPQGEQPDFTGKTLYELVGDEDEVIAWSRLGRTMKDVWRGYAVVVNCTLSALRKRASQDSRAPTVAPGGLPLPQPNSQDGFGDSVSAPVEPSGATLSPCATSQWISVDERLPPPNTEVLIAFDTRTLPATGQLTMFSGIRQWLWPSENNPDEGEPPLAVTHWAFMRHPGEIGEWAQVDRGESSSEGGES